MKKREECLKWLLENFNYIDSFTMIDNTGKIIVKQRYNPRYSDEENEIDNKWCVGKNLLEVFPSLNHEDSSLLQAVSQGELLFYDAQATLNHRGRTSVTNNITFPIINKGKIVGAIEISRDITNIEKKGRQSSPSPIFKSTPSKNAKWTLNDIVTRNPGMLELKDTIHKIADSRSSVLVCGETGTGKELFVSAIHNASDRRNKPFVAINCAAIPESILEGLLFGSEKGAFTGAETKKGLFEEANGGTIYLDEINSMPIMLQAKLLRVLQERAVTPLGASKPVDLDVRFISSTSQPINELLNNGQMRKDILYRLNTINIDIPPLRERKEDIELLAEHFIQKHNTELGKRISGISKESIDFLVTKKWKGNVRELEHVIESSMNLAEDDEKICLEHLPIYLTEEIPSSDEIREEYEDMSLSLNESLEIYEKKLILDVMMSSGWRISDAAKKLKIPRTTLHYKLDKYDIKRR